MSGIEAQRKKPSLGPKLNLNKLSKEIYFSVSQTICSEELISPQIYCGLILFIKYNKNEPHGLFNDTTSTSNQGKRINWTSLKFKTCASKDTAKKASRQVPGDGKG